MNAIGNTLRQTVQKQARDVMQSIDWMNATDYSPASLLQLWTDVRALNATLTSAEQESGSLATAQGNKYASGQASQDRRDSAENAVTQGRRNPATHAGEVSHGAGAVHYDHVVPGGTL